MDDYPRNLREFDERFGSDDDCREYLRQLRWPEGFRCPRCGCTKSSPVRGDLLRCSDCRHQASVTAGTIFQDTRPPLRLWFQAMWWMTTQKNGASALGLQRILGLKRYETAWTMLHRLRRAMVRPGRDLLAGRVEVDECYVGGLEEHLPGRLNLDKALVVVAAQEDGTRIGRIRLRLIPDASSSSLISFVRESVAAGSIVHTDGWRGYSQLENEGFQHEVTVVKGKRETASELLPRVDLVISLLKRWLLGTHQGAVSRKHLDYYLDEFTFRFNRRRSRSRGMLFYRLAQQAVAVDPVTRYQIVHPGKRSRGAQTTTAWGMVSQADIHHIDEPKTAESKRTVFLPDDLAEIIERWAANHPSVNGWLFGSPVTGRPIGATQVRKLLKGAATRHGFDYLGFGLHNGRHTFRANLREAGATPEEQMWAMGHRNLQTTMKYGQDGVDHAEKLSNVVNKVVSILDAKKTGTDE